MAIPFLNKGFAGLSPFLRKSILIGIDSILLLLSVWLSFWLRLANPFHPTFFAAGSWLLISVLLVGLPLYAFTGQYKGLTRYVGSASLYRLAGRNGLLLLFLVCLGVLLVCLRAVAGSRCVASHRFYGRVAVCFAGCTTCSTFRTLRVAIYGAGSWCTVSCGLRLAGNHKIVTFLDDNSAFWGRTINGVTIHPPQILKDLQGSVDQVLLAIPSLPRSLRRRIFEDLQCFGIGVQQVPSVDDLTSGRARIDALRPIVIEDLLGRDEVPADLKLLGPGIRASVVCVTGAGGSIGSELCRQILALSPTRLILLESSEPALYAIEQELNSLLPDGVMLQAVLGSANDLQLLQCLFTRQSVDLVFHAAAYKHVPLVETNPLAGLANNVFSTHQVCRAALESNVGQVVLISTDKAVRPTNVMGASKRLAELVVQAHSLKTTTTLFSMVRFGNVLGSSGSVVPLFRRQIAAGGPITLTHPEIIRYFMTIPEAAMLVLQSSVLAKGGDVFLLDMGEPVRIKALAEQMVRLSGCSLRDAAHPDGDIEIICTGLRPGEKLYEELLIDAESQPTAHPLIYRAEERALLPQQLWPQLTALDIAVASQDVDTALELLEALVPEWQRAPAA